MALLQDLENPVQAAEFGSVTDGNERLQPHADAASLEVRVVERAATAVSGAPPACSPASAAMPTCWGSRKGPHHPVAGNGEYEPRCGSWCRTALR
ncbi:hypothetical protein ACFQU7_37430 [Pseudoroseomonas wenyumeiae]